MVLARNWETERWAFQSKDLGMPIAIHSVVDPRCGCTDGVPYSKN